MPVGRWVRRTAEYVVLTPWPPGPGGAEPVDPDLLVVDLHLDLVVDFGVDLHRGERGVAPSLRVERRDAHEPVDPAFGLEVAVGVLALDQHRGGLDPRLLGVLGVEHLGVEAPPLAPLQVHAQEHLRPVGRLGPAGAGVHLEVGVVGVVLARHLGLELDALELGLDPREDGLQLGLAVRVLAGELERGPRSLRPPRRGSGRWRAWPRGRAGARITSRARSWLFQKSERCVSSEIVFSSALQAARVKGTPARSPACRGPAARGSSRLRARCLLAATANQPDRRSPIGAAPRE